MSTKRILFLTDNFPPEVNAPATRTLEHAREWVKKGHDVTVITCAPNFPHGKVYDGHSNALISKEVMDGIHVVRVWTYIAANEGFVKRILDYISFAVMSFLAGLFIRTDVIVATSPQFFTAVAGRALSAVKFKPWVMEVRDLWPESIVAVGAMSEGKVYRFLEWVEMSLYRSARKIIVVTDAFKAKIVSRGIDASKIDVHKNGVILDLFTPREKDSELLVCIRNWKASKSSPTSAPTAWPMRWRSFWTAFPRPRHSCLQAHFLFIGEGAEKENLLAQAKRLNLTNVTFMPFVPKSEVVRYLSLMDVALVNLKKSDTFKTVIPSKIFEAAALQKPILLGLEGETKGIIESFNAGLCFEPENEAQFLAQCAAILDEAHYNIHQQGCAKLAEAFNRKTIALGVLESITSHG